MPGLLWENEIEAGEPRDSLESCGEAWNSSEIQPANRGMSCIVEVANIDDLVELIKKKVEWAVVLSKLPILKTIASELFLGKIQIEIEADPEIDDCHYVTFEVMVSGDQAEAASLRSEWYRRTAKILNDSCDKVRLVISMCA